MKNVVTVLLLVSLIGKLDAASAQTGLMAAPVIQNRAWTASDKPYKEVTDKIKEEYAQGKSLESIAQEYKALALSRPKDPVAQYAWVCAGRGAVVVSSSEGMMPRYLLDTLTKADPGNVRAYTRYRFCLTDETDLVLPIKDAVSVGDRLLASNPKDGWVRSSLINMLCAAPGGTGKAVPYAVKWVQLEPNNPKAHSSLAQVYFGLWEGSNRKNVVLGNKAVGEYQAYLRLAPVNDNFRRHAQSFIRYVQQAKGQPS